MANTIQDDTSRFAPAKAMPAVRQTRRFSTGKCVSMHTNAPATPGAIVPTDLFGPEVSPTSGDFPAASQSGEQAQHAETGTEQRQGCREWYH
jgi:hypothetical protein